MNHPRTDRRREIELAYYRRNRERINARRRERYAADKRTYVSRSLGHYYQHREEVNMKRVERFKQDARRPRGAWSREVEALRV